MPIILSISLGWLATALLVSYLLLCLHEGGHYIAVRLLGGVPVAILFQWWIWPVGVWYEEIENEAKERLLATAGALTSLIAILIMGVLLPIVGLWPSSGIIFYFDWIWLFLLALIPSYDDWDRIIWSTSRTTLKDRTKKSLKRGGVNWSFILVLSKDYWKSLKEEYKEELQDMKAKELYLENPNN